MADELDVDLQDPELIAEIELVAELMVAASESTTPLSSAAIDSILWRPASDSGARCRGSSR